MSKEIVLTSDKDMDLSDVLYNSKCPNCLEKLYGFEYYPDADGGSWSVTCDNCEREYYLTVSKVKL